LGREVRAVVPLHALAQLEFPGGVVDGAPALGQAGALVLLLVLLHQRVEEMLRHAVVGREIVEVRVERGDWRRQRDGKLLGTGRMREECGKNRQNMRETDHCRLQRRRLTQGYME